MKITSRLGVLLAKIAGKEATLEHMTPPWATNAEEELMLEIADRVDGLESASVPEVASADKGKYLHANETTGALEWAGASGGDSGVLIVHYDPDTLALDKTWSEIYTADVAFILLRSEGESITQALRLFVVETKADSYEGQFDVSAIGSDGDVGSVFTWRTDSADGYPGYTEPPT